MPTIGQLETIWRRRAFDDIGEGGSEDIWSFTDFVNSLVEAEEQWCRRTLGLYDDASTFLHYHAVANDAEFALDDRILQIRRVKPASSALLLLTTLDELDLFHPGWEDFPAGTPKLYMTDHNAKKLCVIPKVKDADTIDLGVSRLPLTSYAATAKVWTQGDTLEILPVYHLDLLDWVTYRLYDYQSRQTETPNAMWQEKSSSPNVELCRIPKS